MISNRCTSLGVAIGFGVLAGLTGCASRAHTVEPYASDETLAADLQEHARELCLPAIEESEGIIKPFVTDGCSLWPDRAWAECCVAHDVRYWCGGSASARKRADLALKSCVEERASVFLGGLMYWGARLGGPPIYPTSYRWGFGRRYPSGYFEYLEPPGEPSNRRRAKREG